MQGRNKGEKMQAGEIKVCKARLNQFIMPIGDVIEKTKAICEPLKATIKKRDTIAIAVGSRGITGIKKITKAVVEYIKELGADVFVVPAMGSHGGATAEGQKAVLNEYGVTEEYIGCPIRSSMEVEQIGQVEGEDSFPVYFDKNALSADGVVVINRVKAHTDFHGLHESGIVKMLVIGLGKHKQALTMHRFGADGLSRLIPIAAKKVLDTVNILGGLAIVEDGMDNTSQIVFASPGEFLKVDSTLLQRSKEIMAKLPFSKIDLLVVDEMGKNISGTGLDTNVIGRLRIKGQQDATPDCDRIAVLDLTDASHGNATGIGLPDIVTEKVLSKVDWKATNENVITSGFYERGFLPLVVENDKVAIEIGSRGNYDTNTIRFARIKNTLELSTVYLSKPLMEELELSGLGERIGEYEELSFIDGKIKVFED